jgi:hypothetical protein
MRSATGAVANWTFVSVVSFLACWVLISTVAARALQGQNAVYDSSGGITNSPDFFDASMFNATGRDFCGVLQYVLTHIVQPTYPAGAVIDARGLPGTTGTSMTCTASPWSGITNPPPTTILLPATGASPIIIPSTWGLPPNTRLIGEGDGIPATGSTPRVAQTTAFTLL